MRVICALAVVTILAVVSRSSNAQVLTEADSNDNAMRYLDHPRFGTKLSRIVFGLHNPTTTNSKAYQRFFDAGGNTFHIHGEGGETATRQTFGHWVNRQQLSDEVCVFMQVAHDDGDDPQFFKDSRFSKSNLEKEIRDNLRMIQRDRIEAVYFGGDNKQYPIADILESMQHQIELGIVRHFGVYNWTPDRIDELEESASATGLQGCDFIITTELCIADPTETVWPGWIPFDDAMKAVVREHRLLVLAWTTDFNQSLFVPGAYDPNDIPDDRRKRRWYTAENTKLIRSLAAHHAHTGVSLRQQNLAWVMSRDFDTVVVIYEDREPSLDEAIGAFEADVPQSLPGE